MTDWQRYEELKRDWVRQNPRATPEQYQDAMRRIAEQAGKKAGGR